MNGKSSKPVNHDENDQQAKLPFCGIIMPIAPMGQYEKSHWDRVRTVLDEAIIDAGYTPRLVSESENIGVIHARIVQNLYDDPIVVCDVSGKNANVMFELGLRLAFNKPTIVIKDDLTDYSFDTSPIEHINYRADLRFDDVRDFKKKLSAVIVATVAEKDSDPSYSPFLGHFGKFEVAGIETKEVGPDQYIIEQIQGLQREIANLSTRVANQSHLVPTGAEFYSPTIFGIDTATMSKARQRAVAASIGVRTADDPVSAALGLSSYLPEKK